MFSRACVKNSVHRGVGVSVRQPPLDRLGRHPPGRQTPPGQMDRLGRHPPPPWADTPWADTPPPADGYWSGWYASYRNVFLLRKENIKYAQIIQILDDTSLDRI